MADLRLRVEGVEYAGWKTARITRSMEALAGAFELSYFDRWTPHDLPWPIVEESPCELLEGDESLITGAVDQRAIDLGHDSHTLTVRGRDAAAALVDCSAVLGQWEFQNASVVSLARALAKPYGIPVAVAPGLAPKAIERITVDPGDTAHEALERACRFAGVLAVSDGKGGIVLTRAGTAKATTALVEGENVLKATIDHEVAGRFRTYKVVGQRPGNDWVTGKAISGVVAQATDVGVRRATRTLLVRAEGAITPAQAVTRAQWEAKVRAARAAVLTVTVQGWRQGSGALWPLNALAQVKIPTLGFDGEVLISDVVMEKGETSGTTTTLRLKRRDAYLPEPVVQNAGLWPELSGGSSPKRAGWRDVGSR